MVCCYRDGDNRDRHVLTHSFPTRRSADLIEEFLAGRKQQEQAQACSYYRESFHLYKISYSIKTTLSGPPGKNVAWVMRQSQCLAATDQRSRSLRGPFHCNL